MTLPCVISVHSGTYVDVRFPGMWPNFCPSITRKRLISTTGLALGAGLLYLSPTTPKGCCCDPEGKGSDMGVSFDSTPFHDHASWCRCITGALTLHNAPTTTWEKGVPAALRCSASSQTSSVAIAPLPIDRLSCKRGAHQHGRPYRPVVLLSCGSFNPPTVAHLRMFELAAHALGKVRSECTSWHPIEHASFCHRVPYRSTASKCDSLHRARS